MLVPLAWTVLVLCAAPLHALPLESDYGTAKREVDLGFARYAGVVNQSSQVTRWKGVAYASPPVGRRRFRAPEPPETLGGVQDASQWPPQCLQGSPGSSGIAANSSENCLYLNIFAPAHASDLPVVVYIPGGGFTRGNAQLDGSDWIVESNHSLVVVTAQYRLGALGFLPASELVSEGLSLNAGLLDQRMAMTFVRRHISKFGGDPSRVTLAGQSAGGGSAIFHAHSPGSGGLFHKVAVMSPFVPHVYRPSDPVPQQALQAVLNSTNCTHSSENPSGTLHCLQNATVQQIIQGSQAAQVQYPLGLGGWLPVQDNDTVTSYPLRAGAALNGDAVMVGHSAEDGPALVLQQVLNLTALHGFLQKMFPRLTSLEREEVVSNYPVREVGSNFATDGINAPFASSVNSAAHGYQAAAALIYGEAFVACPAYWLANQYAEKHRGQGWVYQYSIVPAYHGADMSALWSNVDTLTGPVVEPRAPDWLGAAFKADYKRTWARFVTHGAEWAAWRPNHPVFLNFNQTGGKEVSRPFFSTTANVSYFTSPGLEPTSSLNSAKDWEGDRWDRCGLWARLAPNAFS